MRKTTFNLNEINCYTGPCANCGEVYEATSASDDLEGITFECKKVACGGRVTLGFDRLIVNDADSSSAVDSSSKPTRYC